MGTIYKAQYYCAIFIFFVGLQLTKIPVVTKHFKQCVSLLGLFFCTNCEIVGIQRFIIQHRVLVGMQGCKVCRYILNQAVCIYKVEYFRKILLSLHNLNSSLMVVNICSFLNFFQIRFIYCTKWYNLKKLYTHKINVGSALIKNVSHFQQQTIFILKQILLKLFFEEQRISSRLPSRRCDTQPLINFIIISL